MSTMPSRTTLCGAALLLVVGCGHRLQESAPPATPAPGNQQQNISVNGSVEKGPFVLGSSITVSALDASANPTGQVFKTQTTDDLGQFSLTVAYSGPVGVAAQGYYFDELASSVSTSTLTLQGIGALPASGSAQLNVNVLTHLESARVATLMAAGSSVDDASAQAQTELVHALGLGPAGFTLSRPATATSLAGGNTPDDAYLLSVSLLFLQIATDAAGSADQLPATLQVTLNDARNAFASAGQLPSDTVTALRNAQTKIDPDEIRAALSARYEASSGFAIPDVDEILDSDLDGVPNDDDACPLTASDGGGAANGVCSARHMTTGGVTFEMGGVILLIGDFDNDGTADLVQGELWGGGTFWHGLGQGAMGQPTATVNEQFQGQSTADVDGDGKLDLVGIGNYDLTANLPQYAAWAPGFGDGGFGPPQTMIEPNVLLPTPDVDGGMATYGCLYAPVAVDLNGDGRLDVLSKCQELDLWIYEPTAALVALQLADGGFGPPTKLDLPTAIDIRTLNTGDFDGDGHQDLLIGSCVGPTCGNESGSPGWNPTSGLWLAHGHGDGTFTIESLTFPMGETFLDVLPSDVNGDGKPDLVVRTTDDNDFDVIDVLLNDGAGHFSAAAAYHFAPQGLRTGALPGVFDITGDGVVDLIYIDGTGLTVFPGLSNGWGPAQRGPIFGQFQNQIGSLAIGDLDGDGHTDFAATLNPLPNAAPATAGLLTVIVNHAGWHTW
ncbi:MAG: VCBS repeat-containing protein [Deltaproteobacteria bacterium]|nr:VCBS repeat-containing protein [Deltaproteobacteria bacterium]